MSCMDGLYLLSQILSHHARAYLEQLKGLEAKARSPLLISSNLTVLQKAQTFSALLKILELIDKVGD